MRVRGNCLPSGVGCGGGVGVGVTTGGGVVDLVKGVDGVNGVIGAVPCVVDCVWVDDGVGGSTHCMN